MKKNLITMTILLLAAISVTSCSKENTTIEQPSNCYKVSIRATKAETKAVADGGAATFNEGDVVYVYNNTEGRKGWGGGNLTATSSGKSTTFSGTLNGNYEIGDELILYYKTTSAGIIDNTSQDGALGNVKDAAKAVVTVTSKAGEKPEVTLVTSNASFTNLQSIFRFQFKNTTNDPNLNSAPTIENIRFIRIFSKNDKLLKMYDNLNPSGSNTERGPVTISRNDEIEGNTNNYFYASLLFDENPDDEIIFQVIDSDGKVYSGSKSVPTQSSTNPYNGFVNGKFYNSTVGVKLYTFTIAPGKKVCFSPGDLGVDNGVYSFTEPFADWGENQITTTSTKPSKRVWFDNSEIDWNKDMANNFSIYGISWRVQTWNSSYSSTDEYKYEWNNIIGRTNSGDNPIMNSDVEPYYRVTVAGYPNCLLLPPDETKSTDIGDDLKKSKNVTERNYLNYLAKGFVLLKNTSRVYYYKKWITDLSGNVVYWSVRNNTNRYYLNGNPSGTPVVQWYMRNLRLHARYIHNLY